MGWTISATLVTVAVLLVLACQRASLNVVTLSLALLLGFLLNFSQAGSGTILCWTVLFLAVFVPFRMRSLRQRLLILPILRVYRKAMPSMSRTEREALAAGTTGFEGELFCGSPDWHAFLARPAFALSDREKAFLEGPVNTLCSMIDDWDITHRRADLPPAIWQYLADNGFYGLIIPKEYGGLDFSACAQSEILVRVYGVSPSVGTTIAVPNSLGPAELLLHYGTEAQKNHYLPRLARGEDIPCFALTSPEAGSDASAMPDTGVVCHGLHEGKNSLGIRLNFSKRYITLAPVATVIGLAFRLLDPQHLLGEETEPGITCALIPRNTPGLVVGRRHFPAGVAFQNGPVTGKDVFIPVDWIIGGPAMAGQGWRMLMECLAAGRAISLPASSAGGAQSLVAVTGAYARVRRQFGVSISQFEGIQEVLARMAGYTCLMEGTRLLTAAAIDQGERPAVASAITKCHVTELGRKVGNDAMDVHGGKGICLGPRNYLARGFQAIPVAITVEGANILTRSLIIFGQGAIRCHPCIFREFESAGAEGAAALTAFDAAICQHAGYTLSNGARSLVFALTGGRLVQVPAAAHRRVRGFYRSVTRLAAAFALVSDVSLLLLGGSLKRRECISARLGDVLSQLYMLSGVLKRYHDAGHPKAVYPLVAWVAKTCLHAAQTALAGVFCNYPTRLPALALRLLVFPLGQHFSLPADRLTKKVAQLAVTPGPVRDFLTESVFVGSVSAGSPVALLNDALLKAIAAEVPLKKLHDLVRSRQVYGFTPPVQAADALQKGLLSEAEHVCIMAAAAAREAVIAVDDFAGGALTHGESEMAVPLPQ